MSMPSLPELRAKAHRLRLEKVFNAEQPPLNFAAGGECPPCREKKQLIIKKPKRTPVPITLIAPAPPKNMRNHDYNLAFEQGYAHWYHLPVSSVQGYSDAQIAQIRFCALGTTVAGMGERSIRYVWRVKSVQKLPRHMLNIEQAGALKASDAPYWLFELEQSPIFLKHPIIGFAQHFELKLTLFSQLMATTHWADIPTIKQNIGATT
jgi:hypothetical protein